MARPLNVIPIANFPAKYACGDCTACCTVMGVRELRKQLNRPCIHIGKGCEIYSTRPKTCHDFVCLYVAGQLGSPEKWRPNECGLMVSLRSCRPDGSDPVIEVHEVIPGALQNRERVMFLAQKAFDRYGKGVVYEFAHDVEIEADSPVDGIPLTEKGHYRMCPSCVTGKK